MEVMVLSWNISGHNVSTTSSGLSLLDKHQLVAQEVTRHSPDVVALQEVSLCEWNPEEYPPEVGRLEAALAGAGYRREGCAESHCGWTCIYLHDRLRQHACSVSAYSVGPVVAVEMELQPEREELAPGGPEAATAAGGGSCTPPAEPWHVQQRHWQQQEEQAEEAQRRAQLGGVQPSRLGFVFLEEGQAAVCCEPWSALDPRQHPQPSQKWQPQHIPHMQDIHQACTQQPTRLCLAGCHLEPFDQNAPRRMRQLRALLVEACEQGASHLVVVGDFNMHEGETQGVLNLGLQDAHLAMGEQDSNAHTWNTHVNRYYGPKTVEYTARYDRLCCSENVAVRQLQLVGDQPMADGSYLSDHFGILCKVVI